MGTLLLLYLVFGTGMIWGYTKSKQDPRKPIPKLISMVSAIAIVMVAILSPLINAGPDRVEIEDQYRKSRLNSLAADLATKVTGAGKVLVIHSYDTNNERSNQHLQRSLSYLQEGFAGKASIHKFINPAPPTKNPDEMEMMEEVTGEQLQAVLEAYAECDVVVFLSSLPYGRDQLKDMEVFYMPPSEKDKGYVEEAFPDFDETKLPIIGVSVSSSVRELKDYIKMGRISAAIAWNPSKDFTQVTNPPDSEVLKEWFDQRYLLINSSNVDSLDAAHGKLFVVPKPAKKKK
ncbi:hypothetical protein PQO03_14615 [Lentisphaera profundi]|uniref:Uncharacterized protein n=1 Tax=Lentisphaera profundi TaxID=1658616 RepID=A0ABY7VZC6_9BACT|nr:hypothetical protein [Lentisphaera profundi]WDE99067.1 hypothetical protein PQO03_14615 [Lentisphaera profundi]